MEFIIRRDQLILGRRLISLTPIRRNSNSNNNSSSNTIISSNNNNNRRCYKNSSFRHQRAEAPAVVVETAAAEQNGVVNVEVADCSRTHRQHRRVSMKTRTSTKQVSVIIRPICYLTINRVVCYIFFFFFFKSAAVDILKFEIQIRSHSFQTSSNDVCLKANVHELLNRIADPFSLWNLHSSVTMPGLLRTPGNVITKYATVIIVIGIVDSNVYRCVCV